jgi:2-dehydro-3-deoxyphosphogluconate aldolase/(4S)-4-hydroxy-2-oxoglutarate aldolase
MEKNVLEIVKNNKVVPVAAIENSENAIPVAQALINGGLPLIEVTFRTAAAESSIKKITSEFSDVLVGAGTVLTVEQARKAIEAGASFIVSPGLNEKVVEFVLSKGVTVIPGIMTPSEIEKALSFGLEYVKFFPAEAAGGIKMLNAFSGPYPNMKYMPTGGINLENVSEYLAHPKVFACGGSWILNKRLIDNNGFEIITDIVKETIKVIN